jgi:hypothetical protein
MKKNFFKNEKERMLWVRLNAEHNQYVQRVVNHIDVPLGKINEQFSLMQNSLLQLEHDEIHRDAPRFSFEELVLPHDELLRISKERRDEKLWKVFLTHDLDKFPNEEIDPYDDSIM